MSKRVEQRLESGPGAVIVDIDGTLIVDGSRNNRVIDYVDSFDDTEIIILTGRADGRRAETVAELESFDIGYDQLIMQPSENTVTPDFKEAVAKRFLETFNVMVAIDDDTENRERFRALGITALDVADVPDAANRGVDLTPPAFMRAAARKGLVMDSRHDLANEAHAISKGAMTAATWVCVRDWLREGYDDDVSLALSGVGFSERSRVRTLALAESVVWDIEAQNEGRAKGQALSKMETRVNAADFEIRETDDGMQFSGYAAIFNSDSEPLPFTERIAPGAFRGSLRNRNDIKLLWNHSTGDVLASTRSGTLRITEDARGLYVEADMAPTTVGNNARELIKRGDVDSMSFGFTVARGGDEWNSEGTVRTLNRVSLHEVSIVAFPAYTATAGTTAVRGLDKVALRAEVDADALADALFKVENGEDISADDRQLLTTVIDKLGPTVEPIVEDFTGQQQLLSLKKKKLELLEGAQNGNS
jgi:HK97 family phage prohead protease